MLLRKLRSVALMGERQLETYHSFNFKTKHHDKPSPPPPPYSKHSLHSTLFISLSISLFILLCFFLFFFSSSTPGETVNNKLPTPTSTPTKKCDGSVSVYMYELPAKFNLGLLTNCRHLNVYTDMCPHVANRGLGQPMYTGSGSWYATHQFIAEMIFHARVENHPCRTTQPNENTLFYVPFYGGLHASSKFREPDFKERDRLAIELVDYLRNQPWWQRKQGKDHFLALGRTAWDFMRTSDGPDFGANSLLNLPEVKNMSVLTVERHPWQGQNQFGIPYPSYLHPIDPHELISWQHKMRTQSRPYLFSFVGAPRVGVEKAAIRDQMIKQCNQSQVCHLMECGRTGASKCHQPQEVLKVMRKSEFCLQAPGDSFTRRSTFDSVLAGCIPVFFSPHTAYSQYGWYLPAEKDEYSVYIAEEKGGSIEEELKRIPREKVERMRTSVIGLIPIMTYMHPNATTTPLPGFKDAVDVALQGLFNFVNFNSTLLPTL